jgi:hypothetical protein
MLEVFVQIFRFIVSSKKYWMFPVLFVLITLGLVLFSIEGSVLGPFIYAVF